MSCKIQDFQFDGMQLNEKPYDVRIFYDNDCKLRFSYGGDLNVNYNGEVVTLSGYGIQPQSQSQPPSQTQPEIMTFSSTENSSKCNGEFETVWNMTKDFVENNVHTNTSNPNIILIDDKDKNFDVKMPNLNIRYEFKKTGDNYTSTHCFENKCKDGSNSISLSDYSDNFKFNNNIKLLDIKFCTVDKNSDNKCPTGSVLMSELNYGLPDLPDNKCMSLSNNYSYLL